MTPIICANEFDICISMPDFVTWNDDQSAPNTDLVAALQAMGIVLDITGLHDVYFNETSVGTGDVHVYPCGKYQSVLVIDMYRELSDQLDIVSLSLQVEPAILDRVLPHLRRFFDAAECQVAFRQSSHSQQLRTLLDSGRYPAQVDESGYRQRLISHPHPSL
ncbi:MULTISPECIES: hypothetical protein [Pseudomonas]|uniref:Uncharacterized protein n=1 Tax=Pseudomonas sessilinigenes TaxID=658629 RepID=A0ABX8MKL3_9PSED|nr:MULTISPECIES: hypothetical protein [Pseudomonas]AZC26760.1 hypothetical protein C4K39_5115 [Pseudomonas sessilinigenes]QIH07927.1 hypothetical protein ATY02_15020 [Pseudomonas sp. BIOMIG1BAC]QXH39257.1 hypothetical protein KSS89_23935 [Pseudomonas sessilinigenes]